MIIGVDFDNTIACYDLLFHRVAMERGLITEDVATNKSSVRDYLRAMGREDAWTEMQGYIYGPGIENAQPFPGVAEFFSFCKNNKIPVCIISHKTRTPFMGPEYDLHKYAGQWLENQDFCDTVGGTPQAIYFELTKQEKLQRIATAGCTHFIDDLPELLLEYAFPAGVEKVLFDPNEIHNNVDGVSTVTSWHKVIELVRNSL